MITVSINLLAFFIYDYSWWHTDQGLDFGPILFITGLTAFMAVGLSLVALIWDK